MSVSFSQFVAPAAPSLAFVPTLEQLTGIVRLLIADRWINARADVEVRTLYAWDRYADIAPERLAEAMQSCFAERGSVNAACQGSPRPADRPPEVPHPDYDFEASPDLVLRGPHCYEVGLLMASHLCTIPPTMLGTEIACPACGGDILWEPEAEESKASNPYFPTPLRCPHPRCAAALDHAALTATSRVGRDPILERAPFYQFTLRLLPASAQSRTGTPTTDPALLDGLARICGIPFRTLNRWS